MFYVYILKSKIKSSWKYIGSTNDLKRRFHEHQEGVSKYTSPYRPLFLTSYIAVDSESKARRLERYLKTGSGKAILKKRILMDEVHST